MASAIFPALAILPLLSRGAHVCAYRRGCTRASPLRGTCQTTAPFSSSPRALCTGGLDPGDLKTALFCVSFLWKGGVLAYVGRIHNLKDLKAGAPTQVHTAGESARRVLVKRHSG